MTDDQNRIDAPPTEAEYVAHLRAGCDQCLVCGSPGPSGAWTDFNGQIRCHGCGATYQILSSKHRPEWLADHRLTTADVRVPYCDCFSLVPLARAYRAATGGRLPFGDYFGWSPIPATERDGFYGWLAANAGTLRPAWDDYFRWDDLVAHYHGRCP